MRKSDNVLSDLREYKKQIRNNAIIHILVLVTCLPLILKSIFFDVSLLYIINTIFLSMLNLYCLMLQRYNNIKVNKTIKNYELREIKRKKALSYELENVQSKLNQKVDIVVLERDDKQTVISL